MGWPPHKKVMDQVLQGLPGVVCYTDNILVTGRTDKEHEKSRSCLQATHGVWFSIEATQVSIFPRVSGVPGPGQDYQAFIHLTKR